MKKTKSSEKADLMREGYQKEHDLAVAKIEKALEQKEDKLFLYTHSYYNLMKLNDLELKAQSQKEFNLNNHKDDPVFQKVEEVYRWLINKLCDEYGTKNILEKKMPSSEKKKEFFLSGIMEDIQERKLSKEHYEKLSNFSPHYIANKIYKDKSFKQYRLRTI